MSLELDSGETAEEEKHLAKGQDVHHQLAGEKSLGGMEREGLGELVSEEPGRKILTWVQL